MRTLEGKTFLVGIGAQKAGTTWLHTYLRAHPQVFMSHIKELHYFDSRFRPDMCGEFDRYFLRELEKKLPQASNGNRLRRRKDIVDLIERVRMIYDDMAYDRFFAERVPEQARCFGEITPAYSILPDEGFLDMKGRFERCKVIFIMRDPVDRYCSALRMIQRNSPGFSVEDNFISGLTDPSHIERSQYPRVLDQLDRLFAPEDVFLAFFEQLFSDEEIRRLCEFLGVDHVPGDFAVKQNATWEEAGLPAELLTAARETFSDVYDYCFARFGTELMQVWRP